MSSAGDPAVAARRAWRQHGLAVTQALEEVRVPASGSQHDIAVKIVDAKSRVDASSNSYTVYLIQVWEPHNPSSKSTRLIERRYSDFWKLHQSIQLDTSSIPFPHKHWAGRIGNWTPARIWAPDAYEQLVQDRLQQLDAWLVHVVSLSNRGVVDLRDFLDPNPLLPYQQVNDTSSTYNPFTFTLGSALRQATATMKEFLNNPDSNIPVDLLQHAHALILLNIAKGGVVVTGQMGTGVYIERKGPEAWSAPIAMGTMGLGWGAVIGGDIEQCILIVTDPNANVTHGTVTLGADVGIAVGPFGRSMQPHINSSLSQMYSYGTSKGLLVGISLTGSVLRVRADVNAKFYGQAITVEEILNIDGRNVTAAYPLYHVLHQAQTTDLPSSAFRPSRLWESTTTDGAEENRFSFDV